MLAACKSTKKARMTSQRSRPYGRTEIINIIKTAYPEHSILAEESGYTKAMILSGLLIAGRNDQLSARFPQYAFPFALKTKAD